MYNGIGLLTPRGSGTSGYVSTNKFNLRGGPPQRNFESHSLSDNGPAQRGPNKGILDHNRKRELELKVAQEQDKLEAEGIHSEEEIEDLLSLFREREMAKYADESASAAVPKPGADRQNLETHGMAARKVEQMDKLRVAFGLKDVSEGDAFNRELQEEKKAQRIAEREAKQAAFEAQKAEKAKEAERREKEEKKARKAAEKARKAAEEEAKEAEDARRRRQEEMAARGPPEDRRGRADKERYDDRYMQYGEDGHGGRGGRYGDRERGASTLRMYGKYDAPFKRYAPNEEQDRHGRYGRGSYEDDDRWRPQEDAEVYGGNRERGRDRRDKEAARSSRRHVSEQSPGRESRRAREKASEPLEDTHGRMPPPLEEGRPSAQDKTGEKKVEAPTKRRRAASPSSSSSSSDDSSSSSGTSSSSGGTSSSSGDMTSTG